MTNFRNLSPTDRKKLVIAAAVFGLAVVVIIGQMVLSGGSGASKADQSAQDKVLEQMNAAADAPAPAPAPENAPAPPGPGPGLPRSVKPGS